MYKIYINFIFTLPSLELLIKKKKNSNLFIWRVTRYQYYNLAVVKFNYWMIDFEFRYNYLFCLFFLWFQMFVELKKIVCFFM